MGYNNNNNEIYSDITVELKLAPYLSCNRTRQLTCLNRREPRPRMRLVRELSILPLSRLVIAARRKQVSP